MIVICAFCLISCTYINYINLYCTGTQIHTGEDVVRERALRLLHTKVKTGGGADLLTKVIGYIVISGLDPGHFDADADLWIRTLIADPDPPLSPGVPYLL
jgi:hypothetical protein